ncbi:hypothetical protein O0L34_g9389 [Tuta absoluta]|nr:hypothetical protein O0L34_g9389 [Tuta absoluta]
MMTCIQVSTHLVVLQQVLVAGQARGQVPAERGHDDLHPSEHSPGEQLELVVLQQVLVAGQARGQVPAERGHDDLHPSEHSPGGAAAGACCWAGARPGPCRARP